MTYVNNPTALEVTFPSGDGACAGWLTAPSTSPPWPAVVLAHGLGATRAMALPRYERAFAGAGFAVLSFDYRHLGASPGEPRQLISVARQIEDVTAAVAFVRSHPEIDERRVALWGTSFGAAHVLTIAARDHAIAAAVVQCPIVDGFDASRRIGVRHGLSLTGPIMWDVALRAMHRSRSTIGIVGQPGDRALVTTPGAASGWRSIMPDGYEFDNRLLPSVALELLRYRPARAARSITCPLLVTVSSRETLMDPAIAEHVAVTAPRGEVFHVDADHFDVYHPPLIDEIQARHVAFLRHHLAS